STRTRYATRFMLELALSDGSQPVLLKDISASQNISAGYLEQIVPALKSANLVISSRGYRGGYSLARKANEITLKDIIEAVEGPIALVDCISIYDKKGFGLCSRSGLCAAEEIWSEINEKIINVLALKTLDSLAEKQSKKDKAQIQSYII
ncbi:MAG: Rrf2 family transcriptional regulator, partial [Actinobacteria bacterium]|nr:Rrf2 family transcriptional regulator [Actinomycetota bacterium]